MAVTFPASPLSSLDQTPKMGACEAGLHTQRMLLGKKLKSSLRNLNLRNLTSHNRIFGNMEKKDALLQVTRRVKSLRALQETWVLSLGGEDPLEEGMATHSSILAWRIPWTEEPAGLWSMGSQTLLTLCTSPHPLTRPG